MYDKKEVDMDTVTLSPKFQVVIPSRVRKRMKLRAGEKFEVISYDDRIELIPIRPISQMKGFLKGLDPSFEREREDRV
jgi:AbrB family looped-hinge helix DNA binding protein